MKTLLLTYAVQLVGYFLLAYGVSGGLGSGLSRKGWALVDNFIWLIGVVMALLTSLFSIEAAYNASQGLGPFSAVAFDPALKLWSIALAPMFVAVLSGIGLAKRTVELSRM